MKFRLPSTVYNIISGIGVLLTLTALAIFLTLGVISAFIVEGTSYLGLFMFVIIPPFLIIGLILIPVGMYFTNKKRKAAETEGPVYPVFDFRKDSHRNAASIFIIGTAIFIILTAVGSYEAYHYSESTEFCGQLCHTVMSPEFTAYQNSPHARVACVECHIGEGVDWFVKSKISGLRQVVAVTTGEYSKPIFTPIKDLRPARETCERCHWPEKFYARTLKLEKHFLPNEENSPWDIHLKLKVGGEHTSNALDEGIHWHVNPNVKVEYVAVDNKRQEIPWVRYTNLESGEVKEFIDSDSDFDTSGLDSMVVREMDCMDCHNRPSHEYLSPSDFINTALAEGSISKSIPSIKSQLLEISGEDFSSIDSLKTYAKQNLDEFYSDNYPDFYEKNSELINQALNTFTEVYSENIFPEMNVKWSAYPSNIGHMEFNGCFRCHNDLHETEQGEVISKDCNSCHEIEAQGNPDELITSEFSTPLEFKHPEDIDEAWMEMNCVDCHTGLNP